MTKFDSLTPREILALTLIGESRGEPIEGQVAVASVIRNRFVLNPVKYKSFNDVCLEPEQFSCFNENDPNYSMLSDLADKLISGDVITDPYLRQCIVVANGIINWDIVDNVQSATFYMVTTLLNSDKCPSWAMRRKNEIIKGSQTFFSI